MQQVRIKKISPECFGEAYVGHITVRRLTHTELNVAREKLGLLDLDVKKDRTTKEDFEFMQRVYEYAKGFLVSAEVQRVSDGEKLDLEGLEYETELTTFHSDISKSFLSGWSMGNANGQKQG